MLVVRQGENYNSLVWTLPAPGLAVLWPHDQHVVEFAVSVSAGENRRRQLWRRAAWACFIDSAWSIHTPTFRTILTGCIVSVPTVRVISYCCSLARLCLEPTQITSVFFVVMNRQVKSLEKTVFLSKQCAMSKVIIVRSAVIRSWHRPTTCLFIVRSQPKSSLFGCVQSLLLLWQPCNWF